eukprot:CAMPEP_0197849908 /NCGR_PEP_ID=MMETSP1438-20131217/13630_1 /TAXON_ID=1461541 /ORGANISM="Pterosperma sp., Strain CCMP1384" /LENGTH=204 /DNA_ID=CAMNT_0043462807 /DNA_START=180 /DNA_END=794 /DNA_ORIENTATION=+
MISNGVPNSPDNVNPKPFVVALLLLFIFVTFQSPQQDWGQRRNPNMRPLNGQSVQVHRETIKEKLIIDLSLSNEQLETEVRQLKVDIQTLKRELIKLNTTGTVPAVEDLLLRPTSNEDVEADQTQKQSEGKKGKIQGLRGSVKGEGKSQVVRTRHEPTESRKRVSRDVEAEEEEEEEAVRGGEDGEEVDSLITGTNDAQEVVDE